MVEYGTKIFHPLHGFGIVKHPGISYFKDCYDVDFTGRGGQGSKAWLPKKEVKFFLKKRKKAS